MKRIAAILLLLFTVFSDLSAQGADAPLIVVDGRYFYVHTVLPGETRYSLARRYAVDEGEIVRCNPASAEGLKAGEALRIPAPEPEALARGTRRRAESHVVNRGETAYRIALRYGVTVDELVASNPGLDPALISPGERILIPREALGAATPDEIEETFYRYAEALNAAAEPDETAPSPSRRLGLPEIVLRVDSVRKARPEALFPGFRPKKEEDSDPREPRESAPLDATRPLRAALLLPFTADGAANESMAEYYRGTLLALEDLKVKGISVDLSVYDTERSIEKVREILSDDDFAPDLLIGPWSEEAFEPAARYAEERGIPIVSPQTAVETADNPFVFQARPAAEYRYDKLTPFLTGECNVVLITPATGADGDFLDAIEPLLPADVRRVGFSGRGSAGAIRAALARDRDNVVIVPTLGENTTDAILATLGSIQNNLTATTGRPFPLRVIGSSAWARFHDNDPELFFKLQVLYTTLYYADRTNAAVSAFDRRYLSTFGSLPTAYSCRGYDVAGIFLAALHGHGRDYAGYLGRDEAPRLPVPYRFRQSERGGQWVNDQWVLVQFRNNYLIDVE